MNRQAHRKNPMREKARVRFAFSRFRAWLIMLKRLVIAGCFIPFLFSWPCMAHQQDGPSNHKQQAADTGVYVLIAA